MLYDARTLSVYAQISKGRLGLKIFCFMLSLVREATLQMYDARTLNVYAQFSKGRLLSK